MPSSSKCHFMNRRNHQWITRGQMATTHWDNPFGIMASYCLLSFDLQCICIYSIYQPSLANHVTINTLPLSTQNFICHLSQLGFHRDTGPICDKKWVIQIGRYLLSLDANIQSLPFPSASNCPSRNLETDPDSWNLPLHQACIHAAECVQVRRDMYNILPIISGCLGELRDWLGRCLMIWYVLLRSVWLGQE